MRIGLNLLHAMPKIGGGWNYIANLIHALGKYDRENTYIAFVTPVSHKIVPEQSNFQPVLINIRSELRPLRILYENTLLQLHAIRYKLDLMHWFASTQALFNFVPSAVTVYDLLAFENRETDSPFWKKIYLRRMISRSVKRASLLLPMSQSAADQLHNTFGVPLDDVTVISPIIHSEYYSRSQEEIERLCDKYQLPDRFWLYVSHFYQHKNHSILLRAYHQLKKDGHQPWTLVLRGDPRGKEGEFNRLIWDLDLQGDVLMLPRLPEAELAVLYSAASALVFPSTYEGGGIPLIEAMACGCPIVASDIPAVREFCDNVVAYLNPDNVFAIGEAMLQLQNDLSLRNRLRRLGLQRARRYRSREVVNKLVAAYRSSLDFRVCSSR